MPGASDANGTLAFPQDCTGSSCHATGIDFVTTAGVLLRSGVAAMGATGIQQRTGFLELGTPYLGPPPWNVDVFAWDSSGNSTGVKWVWSQDRQFLGAPLAAAGDPAGGVLFAGDLSLDPSAPLEHAAVVITGNGSSPAVRWGPRPLDAEGTVLGAGVDVLGRALVLTDGTSKFGTGHVSAQWFDRDGSPLTCEFALVSGFIPSAERTIFQTSPIIGGGLVVHRVDLSIRARAWRPVHAAALAIVASGVASFSPAPEWMRARPDTMLQIARGGRGYAALPLGAEAVPCTQRIEMVAPDGTSCGGRDHPIAGGTCDTFELRLGEDGTVIQQLPSSMERGFDDAGNTCTWRWWEGALR